MKIVMIEDSAAYRELCRILLEKVYGPDLEIFEESNAADGLKTCRSVQPDCVLLDYHLPDMTGLQFLDQLNSGGSHDPSFPVVLLTGMNSD